MRIRKSTALARMRTKMGAGFAAESIQGMQVTWIRACMMESENRSAGSQLQ